MEFEMEGWITRDSHEGGVRRRYINSFLSISASISSNEQDEASIYIYIYIPVSRNTNGERKLLYLQVE